MSEAVATLTRIGVHNFASGLLDRLVRNPALTHGAAEQYVSAALVQEAIDITAAFAAATFTPESALDLRNRMTAAVNEAQKKVMDEFMAEKGMQEVKETAPGIHTMRPRSDLN